MDHIDETSRNKISSLMKAYYAMKNVENESMPCHIEEGLFLGSCGAASNMVGLKSLNVTHVLVVANSLAPAHPNDFVYKRIDVADRVDTNLAQYFDECFEFIEEAKRTGGAVLVHCYAGISRRRIM
ncbi:hypothetical protein Syun_007612 [Stephania yunnanensis]|uniref:protein-tyrosine-phosphatase n=1 Tax=Stephania yunnanensis TaxID=152371 RepID=A0AAP0KYW7_9MAGN